MRIDDSSIYVDRHSCIACGICVDRCIMDNLRLSVAPCRQVCPVGMNCQGYIRLIAMGKEDMAIEQLQDFGPFVPLIAAACTAPCESACTRRKKDGAVHILELKRYLVKKYSKELFKVATPTAHSTKKVAIVGSGVFGLASGFKAIQQGHSVTLYPLPSDKKNRDEFSHDIITSLEAAGVVFRQDTSLESDLQSLKLFDAIVLSQTEIQSLVKIDLPKKKSDFSFNFPTHLVTDNIFSYKPNPHKKQGAVFEIASAFETIESVNRYLNGEPLDWGRGFYTQGGAVKAFNIDPRVGSKEPRASQEELVNGLDGITAQKQASRCFGCGRAFEKNQTCWYCLPCELECPHGALEVKIPYLVR